MWWWNSNGEMQVVCANEDCQQRFAVKNAFFLCPQKRCPGYRKVPKEKPADKWEDLCLFRPKRYQYSAACPYSPHFGYRKICPYCWDELPAVTGNTSTIAIIGASQAGKTCFMTSMVRQVGRVLSRKDKFNMAMGWDDKAGEKYFQGLEKTIFEDHLIPSLTSAKEKIRSMQITIRFPLRGWFRRLWHGPQGVVSMVFPDPAGELLQDLEQAYFVNYLGHARAIVLMVNPFSSDKFKTRRQSLIEKDGSLNAVIQKIRHETGTQTGLIRKQLAVVVTKSDENGVIDIDKEEWIAPDGMREVFGEQGHNYNPQLTEAISDRVQQHLEEELELSDVVQAALQNFSQVRFFSASSLGETPWFETKDDGIKIGHLKNPKPRRVEEPLLWILHRWGYL